VLVYFELLFSTVKIFYICIDIGKKIGWDTFWAIFSQTHQVTLPVSNLWKSYICSTFSTAIVAVHVSSLDSLIHVAWQDGGESIYILEHSGVLCLASITLGKYKCMK
jgi:hypothetical protein